MSRSRTAQFARVLDSVLKAREQSDAWQFIKRNSEAIDRIRAEMAAERAREAKP